MNGGGGANHGVIEAIALRRTLDPRPYALSDRSPLVDAVNIPAESVGRCAHELPDPARGPVRVADTGESAQAAVEALRAIGRSAVLVPAEIAVDAPGRGRLWSPTEFLRDWLRTHDAWRSATFAVLDCGCGTGRDAVYLAAHGVRVVAADVDASAIERAAQLQSRYEGVTGRVEWRVVDVENWKASSAGGRFNLVTCFRFLPRRYLSEIRDWLAPGGTLLLETFSPGHAARHGRPASRERVLSIDDAEAIAHQAGLAVREVRPVTCGEVETTRLHAVRER